MNLKIISSEFFNAITSEHLSSTLRDSLEVVLDSSIVKEGVLRDIPFVNTIYNMYQSGVAMQQHLFVKKIENFLRELSNVSFEERLKFVEWMDQYSKQKGEFGETLLLLIDRADSLEKPSILARLLKHHILRDISYEDMMRLCFMVDRVYMPDLNYLTSFTYGIQSNPNIAESLKSDGLLTFAGMDGGNLSEPGSGGVFYELNDYGRMLLKYGLDSAV